MTDLKSIPAVNVGDNGLSLYDVLESLHLRGQMRPLLRQAVSEKVTLEAARKEGLAASDEELQNAADAFRARIGLNKADTTQGWLQANHLSQNQLESSLERSILHRKMFAKVANKEAVEKFFADNRDRFDRARLSRIVVKDEGLAKELLTQINEEGADYVELLKKHSIDERGKRGGPRLVARKRLPANIEQAVFAAKEGELVGPFRMGETWHLIKVHEIRPAQLNGRVAAAIGRLLFRRWLRGQIQQAKIEVKLPEIFNSID